MPETKFTPGEWIYDSYNDILAGSAQNDDLKIICSIHDHPDGESRYEAEQIVKRSATEDSTEENLDDAYYEAQHAICEALGERASSPSESRGSA